MRNCCKQFRLLSQVSHLVFYVQSVITVISGRNFFELMPQLSCTLYVLFKLIFVSVLLLLFFVEADVVFCCCCFLVGGGGGGGGDFHEDLIVYCVL